MPDAPTPAAPADSETLARLRHTLDQLRPGDTLILAHHNAQGGTITHTIGCDPARLVDTARTLLDEALDGLARAANSRANRALRHQAAAALEALPDPLSDDDDAGDEAPADIDRPSRWTLPGQRTPEG